MRKICILGTLVLAILACNTLSAQDFSNKGKDFWVGYGYHQVMTGSNAQEMVLYFATDQVTNISISIPALGYSQNITTPGGNNVITSAPIPKVGGQDARLNSEGLSNKGIHVTSDKPMVAYAHIYNQSVSGASILYPTNTLGKEYYSVNYKNWANTQNANSWFYVVAVDTGTTTVEITPSGNTTGGWSAGVTYTVNLLQGQIYNVMGALINSPANCNPVCTGYDLTGSSIRSVSTGSGGCKRIAVFSGSGRISITCNNNGSSSDNYMVQSMPKSAWGKKYLTAPAFGNQAFNIYRVCVSDPATIVRINGAVTGLPLQNNFFYEIPATNQPQMIEADKPVMVAQYFTSQNACGNGNPGDPEVIYLSSVEQNISSVLWNATPNFAITGHYFNVVIPNTGTAISSFRLDGAPVGGFVPHPQDANYSYLRMNISAGPHRITSDSGFNAIAYGFGNAESYGYNAGTNIKDLYQQIGVATEYGIETTPSVCTNSPFKFKVSLPYCADSIQWNLSNLPGPPVAPPTMIYSSCTPGPGGPDSTTIVNDKTIYWYSLPNFYSFSTVGSYPVTITAYNSANPDGCGNSQDIDFDLVVSSPPTPSFTWTPGGCVAEPFQFTETTPQSPKPTYRFWWDFGDPASGAANNSILRNPTHTFTAPGTYTVRYAAITTPGCLTDTIPNIITVTPLPSASISGNATVCINSSPQPLITFTGTDGTPGYTFTYTINGGAPQTIQTAGTNTSVTLPVPTNVAGTFRYTVTEIRNTGSSLCLQPQNEFVDIVIEADATVNLSSAPGTDNQTVCVNTPITNITYAVGGSGTGGNVSGLPAGLTGTYAGGVITISGTPSVSGTFNYTVSTTGPCLTPTATGTITVIDDATINLTSPPGSDNQTICINTPLTTISYAVGGSGTGGSVVGLPTGITGSFAGGVITISGTPTVSGTFNYTVNTTGPCINATATGTITVTPDATLTLTSAPGTNNQTVCINTPINNITYAVAGSGTGASVSGLPAGLTGSFAAGVVTISGTPTVSGTFNYTVSTTGPCGTPTATGTITINGDATISLTSAPPTANQELCANAALTNITYAVGGTGTGATVTGLPAGVTGVYAGGVVTISGNPSVSGVFNYTVTATGICLPAVTSGTITVNALPTAAFTASIPSCESSTISFTDNSLPNSGIITSWSWDFGDGGTSTLQNPTHTYATAGTYTVLLVVTTDKGCVSTTPAQQLTVYAKPTADFVLPEVCLNDTQAQFTDASTSTAPDIITAWEWDFGDGGTSTLQNPTHGYLATGPYSVQLIVTTNRGCRDTIIQNIFVNGSYPIADFNILNPTTLCANDSVSIVEASTVFPGTITKVEIYWDNVGYPGVFFTDDNPFTGKVYKHLYPNFQTPLTRTFTIRYRAYSGGVCVNDKLEDIIVNAAPLVQFNPIPDICPDAAPYQITQASEVGGVPGSGIFSGLGVSPSGLFNPAVAGPGIHTIKYLYTSTTGGCQDSITQTIKVFAPATADFTVSSPACERQPVIFTDNSASTEGTLTQWRWDFGDGTPVVIRNNGNPVTHTFNGYGNFTVRLNVVTSNGCVSADKVTTVDIKPLARPNFTFPAVSCLPNANVVFTNTSTIPDGTQSQFTYLWNFGDPGSGAVNTSTAMNPSHTYVGTGPYNVNLQVTSGAGCVHDTIIVLNSIHPEPIGSIITDKIDVCIGGSITFTSTSNPLDGTTTQWFWDLADGTTRTTPSFTYTYPTTGIYNVRHYIYNSFNCKSSEAVLTVSVNPFPTVNAGPDKFMLEGGQVQLTPTVTSLHPVTYLWSPAAYLDNPTAAMPFASPPDDMNFTVLVTTDKGCSASDVVFVKVLKKPDIPNIFSPNGDGVHDRWEIKYLDTYPGCTVDVVNRYGQLVFRSVGYATPWDGKVNGRDVPVGTYYYVIDPKNGRKPITGYVDIIR